MKKNENFELSQSKRTTKLQTPIEIALGIDKDGMTTASKLYTFLELDPSNFSRWCSKNILKNKFAEEGKDYFSFVIKDERYNPKPKTDYKLTADFAKKLSMTGSTDRHEQARQYFLACEQGLKVATEKLQSGNVQMFKALSEITESLHSLNKRIADTENKLMQSNEVAESAHQKPYNPWIKKMFPKFSLLEEYFSITRGALYRNILLELENLYNLDTNQIQADYCYENNLKTCYPLDPYEFVPKYRDMIETIVNDALISNGIVSADYPIASQRHITIFDKTVKG